MDQRADAHENLLVRVMTPVGKYWVCKRAPGFTDEAMECIGGSGVMEDSPLPRLFRELADTADREHCARAVLNP
jgi:putative acyl-CoA dehydrogenase